MPVTTYYLEMRAPAPLKLPSTSAGLSVMRADPPTVSFYRFLYHGVGADWNWTSRKALSDLELSTIIQDPDVEIRVLYVAGTPAGFAELDCRDAHSVEVKQFGLFPEFIGRGLGKRFLAATLESAWKRQPERIWLHTCTHDHPRALSVYRQAGFVVYDQTVAHAD